MRFLDFLRRRPAAPQPASQPPRVGEGRLRFTGAMLSDPGRVRASNEDAVVFFAGEESELDAFDLVAAVADGMGGHAAGEVASALALATLRKVLKEARAGPPQALADALSEANRAIRAHARDHPETEGMGTTCTAALVRGDALWIGHIGDSRAYLWRDGALAQLSEDHTLSAQLLRDGAIGEHETAATAGLLLRALGAADEVEPMLTASGLALQRDDRLLLCSDGLHGVVTDEEMRAALQTDDPRLACESLIKAAIAAGAPDNVSVGVFRFHEQAEPAATAPTRPLGLPAASTE